jgi:hypothetical protein
MGEYKSKSEKIVPKLKISHKGIFDFKDVYEGLKRWLMHSGYGNESKNLHEKSYLERIKGDSKQIESRWTARKEVTGYFANVIEISFQSIGVTDVEIEKDGRKVKLQKGKIDITITGTLLKNKNKGWSPLMCSIYENFVIRDRLENYRIGLYSKVYSLHDEIKAILELPY